MKWMFSINLTSGAQPPECELTTEQFEKINELVNKLGSEPYSQNGTIPLWGLGTLGPESYSVYLFDEKAVGNPNWLAEMEPYTGPWMMVQAQKAGGPVQVYRQEENFGGINLKDTVGLWEYLHTIGKPLFERHLRDLGEAINDYCENLFRIPSQEKV